MLMLAVFRDQAKDSNGKYRLTGIETAVYARMALYASEDGAKIYPSLNTLVAELKFSKSTIQRTIKALLDKRRIVLAKQGNSQTHKSNEYKINLTLLPRCVAIQMPTYTDVVDNYVDNTPISVYNPGDNSSPIVPENIGAVPRETRGAVVTAPTHNHISQSLNKNHMIKEPHTDIKNDLLMMKVNKKSIEKWVNEFGFTALTEIIVAMREHESEQRKTIQNKGAYLRKILDNRRSSH
jgi:hypothetical protein